MEQRRRDGRTVAARGAVHALIAAMLLLGAVAACGDDSTAPVSALAGSPTPAISAAEIEQSAERAAAYAKEHIEAWPDLEAFIGGFADQWNVADPTHNDIQTFDKEKALGYWTQWASMTDYTIAVGNIYLSADGAAFEEAWPGAWPTDAGWPVPGPRDPAGTRALETVVFEDGDVVSGDVWYPPDDNELFGFGCFAVDGCPDLEETVARYLSAWSSRDPEAVESLYSEDATFIDSVYGLEARGRRSVGDLAEVRFGSSEIVDIEVLGLYAWTDGHDMPTESHPERGRLAGVAIHYLVTFDREGTETSQDSVTILELGTLSETDIQADPEGLIHVERVYHEPVSLLALSS
jgi:hypothetical protein